MFRTSLTGICRSAVATAISMRAVRAGMPPSPLAAGVTGVSRRARCRRTAALACLLLLPLHEPAAGSIPLAAGTVDVPLQPGRLVAGAANNPAPGAAWRATAQRQIALQEYHVSTSAQGLQAPSRRHAFRTYFDPTGIRVVDRVAAGNPQLLALRLAQVGRPGALTPVAPGTLASHAARVEIRRDALLEWYVNSPAGLEHGFTLSRRSGGTGPLLLELALEWGTAAGGGAYVQIVAETGRRLRYGHLQAVDAAGAVLPVALSAPAAHRLRLQVDDRDAVYPIVIDPVLTADSETLLESDQAGALFGFSVAGAGDVNGDGYADVIVGAWRYDAGETDEGAAFVYLGSAGGIADASPAAAHARLESDQAGAELGEYVAGAGDVNGDGYDDVIVGAWHYDAGETDEGAAFVFLGSAAGIPHGTPATAQARLESDQANAELGENVGGAGDVNGDGYDDVIVGAWHYDADAIDDGGAFIFLGSKAGITGSNPATAATRLHGGQAGAQLGISVDAAGDVNGDGFGDVVVGAHTYDEGETDEGVACVFLGGPAGVADATIATAQARFVSNQPEAWMGVNVSGAGDVNGDGFDDIIVGARRYDVDGKVDAGAAFVFHGSAAGFSDGTPATAPTRILGDQGGGWMGYSVDEAGDINADGYADVIVGAGRYDTGSKDDGAAFLFTGSASGIADAGPASAHARFAIDQAGAFFGSAVAGAGDVDGDGQADFIIGAYHYDCGQVNEGAAFVFPGSALAAADGTGMAPPSYRARCAADNATFPVSRAAAALMLVIGIVALLGIRARRRVSG